MKKNILFISIIFIFLLFSLSCFKKERSNNNITNETIIEEKKDEKEIDLTEMKKIIENSEKMDVEVFFAISILHKNFMEQFMEQVKNKTEEEQKQFFELKNKEFFKTIKYKEEEYLEFQQKNEKVLIDYLNHHPELMKYLVTIN